MRYFIEVSYKGTNYAGFQIQKNAATIQGELEKVLLIVFKTPVYLTGSSRTDAGVHARQNFFHFDLEQVIASSIIYNINALLPLDIVVKTIFPVSNDSHARFLAVSREYSYYITTVKNPFLTETAWYYPFSLDFELLQRASRILFLYTDYTSFSKRNSQVFTHNCSILKSEWTYTDGTILYTVKANRFLRGMVRGLVGTMLLVARRKISLSDFEEIIVSKDCTKANFATPSHGLFLERVEFPELMFNAQ